MNTGLSAQIQERSKPHKTNKENEKSVGIHIRIPSHISDILKEKKDKVGLDWKNLIIKSVSEYADISVPVPILKAEYTKDGKMVVDIAESLTDALDASTYWLGSRHPSRETVLTVQPVLTAFAYHLAHADELLWFWDHSDEYLEEYLEKAFRKIGLDWGNSKANVEALLSVIYTVKPWLWSKKYASDIGKKVLERLEKKYPELKVRLAKEDEDTRHERDMVGKASMYLAGVKGVKEAYKFVKQTEPPLCLSEISVVVEYNGKTECFSFVD